MAIINEGTDATHNAGMGSYSFALGDTFNGALGGGDTVDGVNLNGLTLGQTYTVSLTLSDLSGYSQITLMDQFHYWGAHAMVQDGVAAGQAVNMNTALTTAPQLDGNTLSFEFTATGRQSFSLRVESLVAQTYAITVVDYVAPPAITEGNDTYVGIAGDDNVSLLGGNDIFDGGTGNDTVNGDAGNDTLTGGAGNDVFVIGADNGADVITDFSLGVDQIDVTALGINAIEDMAITDSEGGAVIDLGDGNQITLEGRASSELDNDDFVLVDNIFNGGAGSDKVNGKSGVDIMSGGDGDDQLDGKAGNDVLGGGDGKDKLTGGSGNDTLDGGDDNDLLDGGDGDDNLDGGNKNDRLHGGDGNDVLIGGHGNDQLSGDAGNDILDGGIGKDELTGGAGADVFVFENGSHRDTITDFEDGSDLLDFSGYFGVDSIADLSIFQSGAHTIVSAGGPDGVTLINTDVELIDATDFIF